MRWLVALALLVPVTAQAANKVVSADGQPTIEAAIALVEAAGGGVVTLDSLSTYTNTTSPSWNPPLIIPADVTLRGKGPQATTLQYTATDTTGIQLKGEYSGIEGLRLLGPNTSGDGWGVAVGDTGETIRGNRIINCRIWNIAGDAIHILGYDDSTGTIMILGRYEHTIVGSISGYDVKIGQGCSTQWFNSCTLVGSGSVGVLDYGAASSFRDCVFESPDDRVEIHAENDLSLLVSGCYFEHAASTNDYWFIDIYGLNTRGIAVENCYFTRTGGPIEPRLIRSSSTGRATNMTFSGLTAITPSELSVGDDILLQGEFDSAVIIGGFKDNTSFTDPLPLSVGSRTSGTR